MQLNENEFNVLTYIERNNNKKNTQRKIASETKLSLGSVNTIVNKFQDDGYIKNIDQKILITTKGYDVLEPYRVKRAVFFAAGYGERLIPITYNTPKPMILVNGKRMIETLLDAVVAAGIEEIIIIRSYFAEHFDLLLKKYPNIKFIYNPYIEWNNISSAYLARNYYANAYVFESDLILNNTSLIRKYEYCSNYLSFFTKRTDDYCFKVKKDEITGLEIGGTDCYQLIGISYFNEKDGIQLGKDLEDVFENYPGAKKKLWDYVHLDMKKENYKLKIRECKPGDVIEIDTYDELKKIDSKYDV